MTHRKNIDRRKEKFGYDSVKTFLMVLEDLVKTFSMALANYWYSIFSSFQVETHHMICLKNVEHWHCLVINNILTIRGWYLGNILECNTLNSCWKYSFIGEQHGIERRRSWCHWGRICDSICSIYYYSKLVIFYWIDPKVRIYDWLLFEMYNRTQQSTIKHQTANKKIRLLQNKQF